MTQACVVITTVANEDEARAIARAVVEARLAACAQSFPIASCYRWDGTIVQDTEQMLLFKTSEDKYPELEARIRSLHSYDIPEIIRLGIAGGHGPYLDWIAREVAGTPG